ncbi:MAG: hypothetical protein LBC81_02985 [Tannerellaceae bacterium]|jgi:hypothetical protein|nr:hypothetical protein [Tannerellaceae bacterium]
MKLFAKWNSKDGERASTAVGKINDQKKLAMIALEARSWEARKAAVEKLIAANDQPALKAIIAEYGRVLYGNQKCEELLLFIYNRCNTLLQEQIVSYNGTVIESGRPARSEVVREFHNGSFCDVDYSEEAIPDRRFHAF